jgi:hypothetical protein
MRFTGQQFRYAPFLPVRLVVSAGICAVEFTLTYSGQLKGSKRKVQDKHALRRTFHRQLSKLWSQQPLSGSQVLIPTQKTPGVEGAITVKKLANFTFVPLVTQQLYLFAELDIFLLRPEQRGVLIRHGGDVDARLKTILDGLRVPTSAQELPQDAQPSDTECPFYCLLEDDSLVTSVAVSVAQNLDASGKDDVTAFIKVRIRKSIDAWNNCDF